MKPEHWQRTEQLYSAALELEKSQRAAFLEQTCAGDESLRQEIESLLAPEQQAVNFREEPALEMAAKIPANDQGGSLVGRQIGSYKILSLLGAGRMGEVFLAQDTQLDRKVALSFLCQEIQQDPAARRRFLEEAKSAATLDHPYICKIYGTGEVEDKAFVAMEYVPGQTLQERVEGGPLSLREALEIATEIAEALEEAHERGFIHGDIKPSNIILQSQDHIKVIPEELSSSLTASGATVGTLAYLSPEQVGGQGADTRSDIFSLGVVLYEMLTGVHPFKRSGHMETAHAILSETPPSLSRYTEEIPEVLQHTVMKMLAKEQDERYQTAKRLKADLRGKKLEAEGRSAVSLTVSAATPARQRTYFWAAAAGGVMVLVLLALALFLPFTPAPPKEAIDSIAILPFENRGGDPELEYVSDGMAEGIINRLSQLSSLKKVISSSSVRGYKGKRVDARTVTQEVDVRAVVMGSMTSVGESIQINVELIDGEHNSPLWGDTYTRPRSAIYELEAYLSEEIADALEIQLTGQERERLIRPYTENSEVHEAYLKGRAEYAKSTADGYLKAIQYFEEAIEKEPDYAPAYAGLAYSYFGAAQGVGMISHRKAMPEAEELARKALELDQTLAEAHAVLGDVQRSYYWDWAEAEKEYQLAIELDPNSSDAHVGYASLMSLRGRHDEAIALRKRAQQLDPLNPITRYRAGRQLLEARQYEQAIEQFRAALDLNPNSQPAHGRLADIYEQKGLYEEAAAARQKEWTLGGASQEEVAGLWNAYTTSGAEGYLRWLLDYKTRRRRQEYVRPNELARLHTYLGEKDRAFEWLEKAYRERDGILIYLSVHPWWDPLRSDPRFQDLLQRMNLMP